MSKTVEIARMKRQKNIIDMGLTFSAMMRVFEAGSKKTIAEKLTTNLANFSSINSKESFETFHQNFCNWFVANIKTVKKSKNGIVHSPSRAASYGQAAKVVDIVLKVYVYYSNLPSVEHSAQSVKYLHGAIDTPVLKMLKKRYGEVNVSASTIAEIDRPQYQILQGLVDNEIMDSYKGLINAVQYDDIMWDNLNRS